MDFFDKIKDGINKNSTKISVKSTTMIQKNKLNSEISSLEKNKKELYTMLGEKLYEMKKEEMVELEKLDNIFESLMSLDNTIQLKQDEIDELVRNEQDVLDSLDDKKVCSCGAHLDKDAKFCTQCGNSFIVQEIIVRCECGAELEEDAKFCMSCGRKVV